VRLGQGSIFRLPISRRLGRFAAKTRGTEPIGPDRRIVSFRRPRAGADAARLAGEWSVYPGAVGGVWSRSLDEITEFPAPDERRLRSVRRGSGSEKRRENSDAPDQSM